MTGNYFHHMGDGSGGLGWFSGAQGTTTITNNVFACTGIYPYPAAIPGTPGAVFTHNVITNRCKLEIGKDNQCDDSTGMIARDNLWLANGGVYLGNLGGCSPGPSGSYGQQQPQLLLLGHKQHHRHTDLRGRGRTQ